MAATKLRILNSKVWKDFRFYTIHNNIQKHLYSTDDTSEPTNKPEDKNATKEVSKFAAFYELQNKLKEDITKSGSETSSQNQETFATMLRTSKFIDLGDPEGKKVIGTIFHVVDNDLYIDFGWKFHTVCPRPAKNSDLYQRGTKVNLLVKSLELSSRFLGATTDVTLLEADCVLLGLAK